MGKQATEPATTGRNVAGRAPLWVFGFTLLVVTAAVSTTAPVAARSGSSTAPALAAASDAPLTQYRAFRRMHAKSDRFNQEGWVDAWTELDHGEFRYTIVSERGSDTIRNKVLKAILKREQELIVDGSDKAALTDDNYEFGDIDEPGNGERYVPLKPRRKDVVLVDGRMVLSSDGKDLLRVEGKLAKNPSFWTSLVNIIRHFAKVDGVRVPVATETVAKVKFAGQSRLDVVYEYESINGRPVSVAARRMLASSALGAPNR